MRMVICPYDGGTALVADENPEKAWKGNQEVHTLCSGELHASVSERV